MKPPTRGRSNSQRTFGLAKLIEEALIRPPHKPRTVLSHVADEYADLAAHAPDLQASHANKVIAGELRRGLRA